MSTFVLVHGAWHGGWCWQRTAPLLERAGHEVHTPTLSGLSNKAHVLSPAVGLDTHIEDIVRYIETYDLCDVTLVGHSYGGQVITGVADRIPDRLARRVHLDGFIGDGRPAIELLPDGPAGHYRQSVAEQGFDWLIPLRPLEKLGVTEPLDLEWLTPRLTPHPWKTYTDELPLTGNHEKVTGVFIESIDWMRVFKDYAQIAEDSGWDTYTLNTGHESMVTAPGELADTLLTIVAGDNA